MSRVEVRKSHKLFIGGALTRSESGRTYEVTHAQGNFIANIAQASRKDARDAVLAARSAFAQWSTATAYNRGRVLYCTVKRVCQPEQNAEWYFTPSLSPIRAFTEVKAFWHPIGA